MTLLTEFLQMTLSESELIEAGSITETVMSSAQMLSDLLMRFILNLVVCWIIVHFFYYKKSRRRDYYFTFMAFSSAMLILLFMMGGVEVGVGLTLGLFAIFGVIRYRTETVPIREMTYLFVIIAIAAVNGLTSFFRIDSISSQNPQYVFNYTSLGVTSAANLLMIILIAILESRKLIRHTSTKLILYDRIELIVPEKRAELIADLEKRTGIKIENIEIGHIDFLKDAAFIKIYYTLPEGSTETISQITKAKQFIEQ